MQIAFYSSAYTEEMNVMCSFFTAFYGSVFFLLHLPQEKTCLHKVILSELGHSSFMSVGSPEKEKQMSMQVHDEGIRGLAQLPGQFPTSKHSYLGK